MAIGATESMQWLVGSQTEYTAGNGIDIDNNVISVQVPEATAGNLASLDCQGHIVDSGVSQESLVVQSDLTNYQPKLSPGTGITINNNVISVNNGVSGELVAYYYGTADVWTGPGNDVDNYGSLFRGPDSEGTSRNIFFSAVNDITENNLKSLIRNGYFELKKGYFYTIDFASNGVVYPAVIGGYPMIFDMALFDPLPVHWPPSSLLTIASDGFAQNKAPVHLHADVWYPDIQQPEFRYFGIVNYNIKGIQPTDSVNNTAIRGSGHPNPSVTITVRRI